jgi:cation diffusion facilitator CzcD-associated flavoprotein CzcO
MQAFLARGGKTVIRGMNDFLVPSDLPQIVCFLNVGFSCACDVPAHIYTYSFEPKHDWSATYAGATEICKYYTAFAAKYKLNKYIKLGHHVVGAAWDAAKALWTVSVLNLASGETFFQTCEILINAGGILNNWKWPQIEGVHDFKGRLVHTAAWDQDLSLKGKKVGVIGNG